MAKDWKELSDDEILNFDGPQTAEIARYERIMQKRNSDALMEVRAGLFDVKKAMHIVTDKIDARLASAEAAQRVAAESQTKLQRAALGLTIVIAVSTVAYTWITWQSVQAQREANQIQKSARDSEKAK